MAYPTNYEDALMMSRTRKRKLGNSTYLAIEGDTFGIRYHSTNVVTFHADGRTVLDSGGWRTSTTKDRMNCAGVRVWQQGGVWYLVEPTTGQERVFADGLTIHADGRITGDDSHNPKAAAKLRKQVNRYSKDFIAAVARGEVKHGDKDDCFFCQFDMPGDDHIRSHIEERYYVGSLLTRAIEKHGQGMSMAARAWISDRWAGTHNFGPGSHIAGVVSGQVAKVLRNHLLSKLAMAA